MATHQRGTGWQNLGFALATVAVMLLLVVGVPVFVELTFQAVEPWLPR